MAQTDSDSSNIKTKWAVVAIVAAAVIGFVAGYIASDDEEQVMALQGQLTEASTAIDTHKGAAETSAQQAEQLNAELEKAQSDAADRKKSLEDQLAAANARITTLESEKSMQESQLDSEKHKAAGLEMNVSELEDALRPYLSNKTEVGVALAKDGVWLVDKQVSVYLSFIDPSGEKVRIKVGDASGEASADYYTIGMNDTATYRYLGRSCKIGLVKVEDKSATLSFQC